MRQQTLSFIDQFRPIDWFAHVGEPIDGQDISRVTDWKSAVAASQSDGSKYARLEARNILTETLSYDFPDRDDEWNALVEEIKAIILPLIAEKCQGVATENNLPKAFIDCVNWNFLAACMEQEYADCVAPRFFTEWVAWHLNGHFPCGWQGNFPEGCLIVF